MTVQDDTTAESGRYPEETSQFQDLLGYRLVRWSEGLATVELPLAQRHMNRSGIAHGGVHASLLDTAMGYAGCWAADAAGRRAAVTLSLTVNFVAPAQGTRLIAEGRLTGGGRRSFFTEGRLTDELGTLVATASAVFRRIG